MGGITFLSCTPTKTKKMIQLVKNVKLIYITRTRFQLLLTIYRCKLVTFFRYTSSTANI